MNLAEFKSWFEGFCENLDGPPSEKQWKRIKAKVGEIRDLPPQVITREVLRDYGPWRPYYSTWAVAQNSVGGLAQPFNGSMGMSGDNLQKLQAYCAAKPNGGDIDGGPLNQVIDAKDLFRDMGRHDAQAMA